MIKPTIGRDVWYVPAENEGHLTSDGAQPLTSKVCYVWSDDMVNLLVVNMDGCSYPKTSVPLFQGSAEDCPLGSCCWMPFQQKQAKKQAEEAGEAKNAEEVVGKEAAIQSMT